MKGTPSPAHYLMVIGGSLTLLTALVILLIAVFNPFRYGFIFSSSTAPFSALFSVVLTLLPAIAVLYFGQRSLRRPETQVRSALVVVVMSVISLVGVTGSGVLVYVGVFFSGPPISFAGGLTWVLLSRGRDLSNSGSSPI